MLFAGAAEIVYAAMMPRTDGFTKLGPSLFCVFFITVKYVLTLFIHSDEIPVGTAYAVWVGIGAGGRSQRFSFLMSVLHRFSFVDLRPQSSFRNRNYCG
ncbi:hypothetical protein J7E21_02340 [Planococcus sp. ISL-109]|nr:hypothetical protein [Planococcus sp. ISL-109]